MDGPGGLLGRRYPWAEAVDGPGGLLGRRHPWAQDMLWREAGPPRRMLSSGHFDGKCRLRPLILYDRMAFHLYFAHM